MSKIRTYQDLLEEKKHLEVELLNKRELIRMDVADLKEEWRPVTDLLSGLGKMTTKGKTNPLLAIGIDIIGEVLVKNILLTRSGWITRLVVPFLAKNFSTHILNKDGTSIFRQLIDRFRNHKSNGQHIIENK